MRITWGAHENVGGWPPRPLLPTVSDSVVLGWRTENMLFWQISKWYWCYWSLYHALRSSALNHLRSSGLIFFFLEYSIVNLSIPTTQFQTFVILPFLFHFSLPPSLISFFTSGPPSLVFFFQLYWDIFGMHHCINLGHIAWCFDLPILWNDYHRFS